MAVISTVFNYLKNRKNPVRIKLTLFVTAFESLNHGEITLQQFSSPNCAVVEALNLECCVNMQKV